MNESINLQILWYSLRQTYFPHRLDVDQYKVEWSRRRQKRVLASVNIRRRIVRVAKELQAPTYYQWLEPLLFHEMCHAVLDPALIRKNGKTRWHGPEFRALERLHPRSKQLDIWIKGGGFRQAVRSHRSRTAALKRVRTGRISNGINNGP